ncbi:SMP-30/gluconolactonase/LRE family protein [Marisediminicola senii]|uniref:SMP-30/gluconolactonase/LRE family protein n=1 Tax=Marisediminicola senii TaxID=2711233 RepID=UPI0013ED2CA9|nr:SMP-30/gluconolactonase/LRE family protein [Marisediminicola senii]
MTNYQARPATAESFRLSEGPLWDAPRNRVLWVDIEGRAVLEGSLAGDLVLVTARHEFDTRVGAVVPAADGRLLVAAQEQLLVVQPNGDRTPGPRFVTSGVDSRANDGSVDPAGRFLIGTLALDEREKQESLYRVEDDGSLTTIDDDLTLSNGLAWSPDGAVFYSTDTTSKTIYSRSYDKATGDVGERRVHLTLDSGSPDGLCCDADGTLWVAVFGEGEIRHFGTDGALLDTVTVPAPNTTSVAFIGPNLDTLLITTGRDNLSPEELAEYPDSGKLFTARVGATGQYSTPWSGSWAADA